MSNTVLKIENLSKLYRLGQVGTGTLSHDLNRWWHKIRGKEDPYAQVGQINDRSKKAASDYVWALKDINFEVKKGEILGIIGKNGAGKSTLLKIISQITAPTTGSIKAKGRIASLLEVGTGMHPEMTAKENIYLNGAILGMNKKEIDAKFDEIIDFSGCTMYVDTPIKRFSSGMRVRLGFAVAAFLEPEILIVDEVLAVGDADFQKKAIGKMQEISSGNGRTVLFVSHNMASIKKLCNRTILINNGSVAFDDKTESTITNYLSNIREKNAQISLEERIRQGNKNAYIKNIKIYNAKTNNTIIRTGDSCVFEFNYESIKNLNFKTLEFSFGIVDHHGQMLFRNNTQENKLIINQLSKNGIIKCFIDKMPLKVGTYFLGYRLLINGEESDYIQGADAFSFKIYEGDFYGFGKTSTHSPICINYNWAYE